MRDWATGESGIAYGRGGSGAHLARADKMPLFSRLSHLGCASSSVLLAAGDSKTRADWRKWDESFLPGLFACVVVSKVIAQEIGTCTIARVGFLLILGIDERAFLGERLARLA